MTDTHDTPEAALAAALRLAGFEPDFNVCASCGHDGGDHDLGNWCLLCPRPDVPARPIDGRLAAGWCYFASMTASEKWEHGIAAILAAEPRLRLDVDGERLRRQNHEAAERHDREMAEMRSRLARFDMAVKRARELVRGTPVNWTNVPGSQEPDGWWTYTSQQNREILIAAVHDAALAPSEP